RRDAVRAEQPGRKVPVRADPGSEDPGLALDLRPAGMGQPIRPFDGSDYTVDDLCQRDAHHPGIRTLSVVETCVELAVAHVVEGRPGDFALELDLQQRVALQGRRRELPQTLKLRIGQRSDADATGDRAPDRARLVAQRL